MAIEQNAATVSILRPASEALAAMGPEDRANYRLPDNALRAVHFRWGAGPRAERWGLGRL
jgi:hypothetical protein